MNMTVYKFVFVLNKLLNEISFFLFFHTFFLESFAVLLAVLSKPAMNEIFLVLVSYVIILTFLAIEICIFFAASNRYLYVYILNVIVNIFQTSKKKNNSKPLTTRRQ